MLYTVKSKIMRYTEERKRQIANEIQWLKDKLKTIPSKKQKYRKNIEYQIKESELNLSLGIFE